MKRLIVAIGGLALALSFAAPTAAAAQSCDEDCIDVRCVVKPEWTGQWDCKEQVSTCWFQYCEALSVRNLALVGILEGGTPHKDLIEADQRVEAVLSVGRVIASAEAVRRSCDGGLVGLFLGNEEAAALRKSIRTVAF